MSLNVWPRSDASRFEALADDEATSLLSSPPVLDGQRTVADQAVDVANAHGLEEPPELTDFVVDLLDADDLLDKPTWHFSRGEKQMAGLILAFSRPFERLVLIDPTAGLDARRSRDLLEFLADLGSDTEIDVASDAEVFGLA